jgi:malate dehydrogenase
VRASNFLSEAQPSLPPSTDVTVVGGHAGITILPLWSQVKGVSLPADTLEKLTKRVQFGGDEVVAAKAVKAMVDGVETAARGGSATLSMAYAGARFVNSVLRGLAGEKGVSECAFVESSANPGLPFFATRVELGKGGAEKVHPIGAVSASEKVWLEKMQKELGDQIKKGVTFAETYQAKH